MIKRDLKINSYVIKQVLELCEKAYPEEACGIIIGPKDKNDAIGIFPVKNIQNELHAKDPERYPRDAKTAYNMDPKDFALVETECKIKDFEYKIFYHSHPDHGVYFSDEDKEIAAPWGEPSFPEVGHMVVSVEKGKAQGASEFYWEDETKEFVERKLV